MTSESKGSDEPGPKQRALSGIRLLLHRMSLVLTVLVGIALANETVERWGLHLHDMAKGLFEDIGWFNPEQFEEDFVDAALNCRGKILSRQESMGLFPPTWRPHVFRECPRISGP